MTSQYQRWSPWSLKVDTRCSQGKTFLKWARNHPHQQRKPKAACSESFGAWTNEWKIVLLDQANTMYLFEKTADSKCDRSKVWKVWDHFNISTIAQMHWLARLIYWPSAGTQHSRWWIYYTRLLFNRTREINRTVLYLLNTMLAWNNGESILLYT